MPAKEWKEKGLTWKAGFQTSRKVLHREALSQFKEDRVEDPLLRQPLMAQPIFLPSKT